VFSVELRSGVGDVRVLCGAAVRSWWCVTVFSVELRSGLGGV
jgi:hypothetical protein